MSKATLRRISDDATDGMACPDAEVASVRRLCRSSPERVVEMLRGSGTSSDAQGTKVVDKRKGTGVGPALVGVGELVKSERMSAYQIATWRKLVDAGVVESLAFNILHSANVITSSPIMPDDIREEAAKQVASRQTIYTSNVMLITYIICYRCRLPITLPWRSSLIHRDCFISHRLLRIPYFSLL